MTLYKTLSPILQTSSPHKSDTGYSRTLADTVIAVREAGVDASVQTEILKEVSLKLAEAKAALVKLQEVEVSYTSNIKSA